MAMSAASIAAAQAATGFYAGATIGQARDDMAGLSKHSDTDYSLLAGYQLNPYFSVEGNYADYGKQAYYTGQGISNSSWGLFAVGYLPISSISDSLSLYGKLGMAQAHTSTDLSGSSNRSHLAYGAGLQYAVASNVDLRAGYDRVSAGNGTTIAQSNINSYSIGAIYRF
jgi:opacity protein-like surface antigen